MEQTAAVLLIYVVFVRLKLFTLGTVLTPSIRCFMHLIAFLHSHLDLGFVIPYSRVYACLFTKILRLTTVIHEIYHRKYLL